MPDLKTTQTPDADTGPSADLRTLADRITRRPPMKETEADRATADRAYGVAAGELRQFIERVESLTEDKAQIGDEIKAVFAEAKARGYDTKVMRRVIALRKRHPDDIAEEEAVLDLYRAALGMGK